MIDVTLTVEDNSTIGLLRLLLLVLFMLRRGFYNLLMITDSFNTIFILSQLECSLYRVFFLTGPPEFAKCWPVRNRFQKNVRVPDWPPLMIEKSLSA